MGFCSNGILVGSGQWWRGGHGGGVVVVTKHWRRDARGWGKVHTRVEEKIGKKQKKKKYILLCRYIIFMSRIRK